MRARPQATFQRFPDVRVSARDCGAVKLAQGLRASWRRARRFGDVWRRFGDVLATPLRRLCAVSALPRAALNRPQPLAGGGGRLAPPGAAASEVTRGRRSASRSASRGGGGLGADHTDWRTVVSGGMENSATATSSKPTSETSCGTRKAGQCGGRRSANGHLVVGRSAVKDTAREGPAPPAGRWVPVYFDISGRESSLGRRLAVFPSKPARRSRASACWWAPVMKAICRCPRLSRCSAARWA